MKPIQFISTGNEINEFLINDVAIKILEEETRFGFLLLLYI
jgi:hypothetical protein